VSGPKQIAVTRDYQPEPAAMAQALEFLLKTPVNQGGNPSLAAPDDTRGDSKHDSRARIILHES
jgi:hypothetical protein